MKRFNTIFKMDVFATDDDLGGTRGLLTLGTDVHFQFEDKVIRAVGPDVRLEYKREQVGRFEAWIPE